MARSKYHRTAVLTSAVRHHTLGPLPSGINNQVCHTRGKMHLTARIKYRLAHGLDHIRKAVSPDMRMGVHHHIIRCAMLMESDNIRSTDPRFLLRVYSLPSL